MVTSLYSPSWYRVAGLKPRIRSHVEIHRHNYRGELWYILQDHVSGRFQRFTPAAYFLIGLMDGKRTVDEIWEAGRQKFRDDAPTQEEMIRLLSQLHAVDVLQCDVPPDTIELLKRFEKRQSSRWKQNIRNPLFMRFSLLDPEKFLIWFKPIARPFFGWIGTLLWLFVVGVGVFLAGAHWPELTENITDRILAPQNIFLLWLTFPFLKIFHEFGHAFAVKVMGGEVHEMGIMMLVLTPIPYVDASSASAFHNKWERIKVGAAGMAVELFIGALALFIWINMEPGTIRAILYNVIFLAGVSSLLFNGNPLLRYDAYYILSDLLEIPNLGQRGIQYVIYLLQRYLFGLRDLEPPLSISGERLWFVIYTILSFIYRIFIYTGIILFITSKFFVVGILIGGWAVVSMFILPGAKGIKFLISSPRLIRKRMRAILVSSFILTGIIAIVLFLPVPLSTLAEGVIWVPEQSFVRAETDGFVERIIALPGQQVQKGDPLIKCSDPFLATHLQILESRLRELKALYETQLLSDRVKSGVTNDEIKHVKGQIEDARKRAHDLTIRSLTNGLLLIPMVQDLPGRFVKRGDLLGYVIDRSTITARVVVSQSDVDFVRRKTIGVQIRFPERLSAALPALVRREVPAATEQLPSRVLSQQGGGKIAIDPRDTHGIKAFQKLFLFDIELPDLRGLYNVGGRVYVRFDHGDEPLIWRWYRGIRQMFLRRFSV